MPTTPRGIWTPASTDNWDLVVDLGAMADTIDDAIDVAQSVALAPVQEFSALASLTASTPPDGTLATADDAPGAIFSRTNGQWIARSPIVSATPMTSGTPVGTLRFW